MHAHVYVRLCVCVMVLMNLSGLRTGGDVTADRLPACMLRAPAVFVPSLQPPHQPAPLLLTQSLAPHICCVLATDSKLQHPGPLSDSIPISSHVPPLSLQHHYPAHLLCVCLSPSFSLILICFPPSVCHIHPGCSTPSTLSDFSPLSVFLSLLLYFSSFVLLLCHATQRSLPYTFPPLPLYFLTSRSLLSRLHRFLSCYSLLLSLVLLPIPLSSPLLPSPLCPTPLSLSGNRCCLSDLIITG